MKTHDDILSALNGVRTSATCEADIQRGLSIWLRTTQGIACREQAILGRNEIIDLLHDESGVGIELKVKGSWSSVARQLARYARHASIKSLILVTTRASHRQVPSTLNGKRISVVFIMSSL